MKEGGLTYSNACRVYEVMCGVFSDGIVTGNRVTIGRVGALMPVWRPPREIRMHFRVKKGKKVETGVHRTYHMDGRFEFRFRLYKKFIDSTQLTWFTDTSE
jgi:hypothetical protein